MSSTAPDLAALLNDMAAGTKDKNSRQDSLEGETLRQSEGDITVYQLLSWGVPIFVFSCG